MNVLVACEYSGIVRDAFLDAGHQAMSCDLLSTESKPDLHIIGDIMDVINRFLVGVDLVIAHPPCTHMAVSGNRWYAGSKERAEAIKWTTDLWYRMTSKVPMVAMENPVGALSTAFRPPDQYIQPWQFGHPESKKTGLWLHNLPPLKATHDKPEVIEERVWRMGPSPDRAKERSRFYPGIAKAMAEQWGNTVTAGRSEK